jgi:hypothetical protein
VPSGDKKGETTISWSGGKVYVSMDGGKESLFESASRLKVANWILTGSGYDFAFTIQITPGFSPKSLLLGKTIIVSCRNALATPPPVRSLARVRVTLCAWRLATRAKNVGEFKEP